LVDQLLLATARRLGQTADGLVLVQVLGAQDDPGLPGEMQATVTLRPVSCGTELSVVQEGIPEMIPLEACYLGWQESLVLLVQLVEAEIRP
jgi:hypothetical protein